MTAQNCFPNNGALSLNAFFLDRWDTKAVDNNIRNKKRTHHRASSICSLASQ